MWAWLTPKTSPSSHGLDGGKNLTMYTTVSTKACSGRKDMLTRDKLASVSVAYRGGEGGGVGGLEPPPPIGVSKKIKMRRLQIFRM